MAKVDVVLFQECKLDNTSCFFKDLVRNRSWEFFFEHGPSTRSAGVGIWIRKGLSLGHQIHVTSMPILRGRTTAVELTHGLERLLIVNCYAPDSSKGTQNRISIRSLDKH